jgi:hypothetical protein
LRRFKDLCKGANLGLFEASVSNGLKFSELAPMVFFDLRQLSASQASQKQLIILESRGARPADEVAGVRLQKTRTFLQDPATPVRLVVLALCSEVSRWWTAW